ncbi:MAG: polysaccharide biosynthesis C-terminal domain-containing protein [Bacteroidota bacterium]
MFRKILATTGSRLIIALLSFLILFLNAHYLGASGLGDTSFIVLGITLILVVNNIVGGSGMVFLSSRVDAVHLLIPGYVWAILVALFFRLLFYFVNLVPAPYHWDVIILSLLFSFSQVHLNILLGKERIKVFNILNLVQYGVQASALLILFLWLGKAGVSSFLLSLYLSYGIIFLVTFLLLIPLMKSFNKIGIDEVIRQIFKLGLVNQLAYIAQVLNYRMSYYFLNSFFGRSFTGMFHFGNQLSEGTWIVGRSVATIQYTRIANANDKVYAAHLTLQLAKFTFVVTLAMLLCMLCIPDSFFAFFGKDFNETRLVISCLAVGILSNAVSMMFSHYFAGLGKPIYNMWASMLGLVFTSGLGFILIPRYGLVGAGVTASVSYTVMLVFQMILFFRQTGEKLRSLLIRGSDIAFFRAEVKKLFL